MESPLYSYFSHQGLYSDIVEVETVEIQPDAWFSKVLPPSSSVGFVIIPTLIIVCLVCLVIYLVQRHKRLQNSFSRFANTHYDTKTGATRIGDALDDDEHEHQEVPHNFADDEPLVLA